MGHEKCVADTHIFPHEQSFCERRPFRRGFAGSSRFRASELRKAAGDRDALAKAARDLRYWNARRASAQLVAPDPDISTVQFGSTVTIVRDDGREQTFRIVGEDEADPARGTVSHASPLARALLRKAVGDVVKAGRDEAEITAIE